MKKLPRVVRSLLSCQAQRLLTGTSENQRKRLIRNMISHFTFLAEQCR
jgi:hypothetical protein